MEPLIHLSDTGIGFLINLDKLYTIKDGIIYDAKQMLEDVKKITDEAKEAEGFKINQPGMDEFFKKYEKP